MSRASVTPVTPGLSITARAQSEQGEPHARKGVTGCNQDNGLSLDVPEIFVEAVAERVAELLAARQPQTAPELLTAVEAAEFLRCGKQRIYDLVSQDRLPHLKDGARVLFRRADLLAYLESPQQRPNQSL